MAKINILFDEKNYSIDEANLAPATDALKAHLETLKGGESGGSLAFGKQYKFKLNLTMDDFAAYVKDATADMVAGNGGIYSVVEVRKIGRYSDGVRLSYWGGGEIEPGVSFEPCAILQVLNSNLQKDYRYVINASVAGELFGQSGYTDGDGWYSTSYGETISKTGEVGRYTIPADVAMANTLENTAILFKIPSASRSGAIKEGGTYTLKTNLHDINPSDFMYTPFDPEAVPGMYTVANFPENEIALVYLDATGVKTVLGVNDTNTDAWMLSDFGTQTYIWARKYVADTDNTVADNDFGWMDWLTKQPVTEPITLTIPSPYDASAGYSLDELAVFFDIPSAGGTLEFGTDWKFKDVITVEDFEAVLSHYFDSAAESEKTVGVAFNESKNEGFTIQKMVYPNEMGTLYMLLYLEKGTTAPPVSFFNASLLTGAAKEQFPAEMGWCDNDGIPLNAAPTILNMPEDVFVYYIDGTDDASFNPEYFAPIFDVPVTGNLDITLDGAVYKVDSTKLAPATNSLIAHLETLKGGEGGTLVEGETYTLKNNLNDIDASYCMKIPHEIMEGVYTIFRFDPNVEPIAHATGLGYLTEEAFAGTLRAPYPSDGWMFLPPDGSRMYAYPRKIFDDNDEVIDNNLGWLSEEGFGAEVSVTIPSPYDTSFGYSLDELAVFFDIPTSGNEGDTKIVINGVEYWVDSAKLADAKSALAAHLGELAKETLSAPFANIDTNTLNIYDDTGLATSFDILVDGEIKASVTKEGV